MTHMTPMTTEHLAVDVSGAQALRGKAHAGDKEALRAAARQFESLMVAQMLKTMRATEFSSRSDPLTGGQGGKVYQELLDQQWSSHITKGRGMGFAEMIVKSLERNGQTASSTVTPPAK